MSEKMGIVLTLSQLEESGKWMYDALCVYLSLYSNHISRTALTFLIGIVVLSFADLTNDDMYMYECVKLLVE